MKKADLFFNVVRLPVDFGLLLLAGVSTYLLRTQLLSSLRPVYFEFNLPLLNYLSLVAVVAVVFLACYAMAGLYSMKRIGKTEELMRVVLASSAGIMTVIIYIFLRQELFNSRFLVLGAWLLATIFVALGRLLIRYFQHIAVTKYNFGIQRAVVIGNDELANNLKEHLENDHSSGYRILAHWNEPKIEELSRLGDSVDEVLLITPSYADSKILELVDYCHEHHIIFKFVPNLYQTLTKHLDVDMIGTVPVIELKRTPLDGWGRVFKRSVDITASLVGIVLLSPIFILIALAIKIDSPGSVFVKLRRVSKNREFDLYKFRSMINNAHDLNLQMRQLGNDRPDAGPLWKMKNDPRVTRVGRFIRRYRIDELAQFINIFRGDMSLVGPRPHQPDEVAQYQKHHKKVLAIKAGATGLAQVSGSSDIPFDEEVKLDSFYIENWSMGLDLRIIFRTIFKIFNDRSAV